MHLLIFSFFSIVSVFRHLHQHWQRLNKYLASFCDLFVQQCYFAYVKASFKPDIIGVDPNKRFRDFVQWARVQSLLSYIYIYIFFFFQLFYFLLFPIYSPFARKMRHVPDKDQMWVIVFLEQIHSYQGIFSKRFKIKTS